MRCDDDRPVHHLLCATTSRDHLTRPPPRRRPPLAIVRAHRSDVTSIHPSSAPPSSGRHRPGRAVRPTGRDDPDRAVRPTVRPTASTASIAREPYPSKYLEQMTSSGGGIHRVRHTSTTGTHSHPPTRVYRSRSHRISLEVAISRAGTTHDWTRVLDRGTRVPHSIRPITTRRDHPLDATRPRTRPTA